MKQAKATMIEVQQHRYDDGDRYYYDWTTTVDGATVTLVSDTSVYDANVEHAIEEGIKNHFGKALDFRLI